MKKRIDVGLSFAISYILMAFIPTLVCVVFFYPNTRDEIAERTSESASLQVEQGMKALDRQLEIIYNIPNVLLNDNEIVRSEIEHEPWKNLHISGEIKKIIKNNSIIKDVLIFSRSQSYFFSGYHNNVSVDNLLKLGGKVGFQYEHWKYEDILPALDTLYGQMERPAESMLLSGIKCNNIITFISTIPRKNRLAYATTMVLISGDELIGGFSNTGEENTVGYILYNADKEKIYQSFEAEDDLMERITTEIKKEKVEKELVRLDKTHLLTASRSKNSGWTLAKVTSLSAMTQRIEDLEKKVIFVTLGLSVLLGILGYFFMQLNYLPIKEIAMQLKRGQSNRKNQRIIKLGYYEDIENAISLLKDDNSALSVNLKEAEPKLRHHYFMEMLSESDKMEAGFVAELKKTGLVVDKAWYQVLVINYPSDGFRQQAMQEINGYKGLFIQADFLQNYYKLVILIGGEQEQTAASFLTEWLRAKFWYRESEIGIGGVINSILQISASYSQAYVALDYAIMCGDKGKEVFYDKLPDSLFKMHSYPLDLIQALGFAVHKNDISEVQVLMRQINYIIQMKEELPPYYIRSLFYNAASVFVDKAKEDMNMEQNSRVARIFSSQMTSVQMVETLNELLLQYKGNVEEKLKNEFNAPLAEALLYIRENYHLSTLSLTDVAEHCGMTPTYFSYLFKEKNGCNFKEYVDALRLEKSRELLSKTDWKIEEIASMIGYNSSYSFSRFFKNYVAVSPKEYREMIKAEEKTETGR